VVFGCLIATQGLAMICAQSAHDRRNPYAVFVCTDRKCGIGGCVHVDHVRLVHERRAIRDFWASCLKSS
jgi:hypothetical protein